jgi:dATP pyrophosphohydrolase
VRAPFQVLVIPFRRSPTGEHQVALFLRADALCWQAIAGGGEGAETPLAAARREAAEEAAIPPGRPFYALHATASIPADEVAPGTWPPHVLAIPEHAFAVDVGDHAIALSHEHCRFAWLSVAMALNVARWPSNREAIAELDTRLRCGELIDARDQPAAPVTPAP